MTRINKLNDKLLSGSRMSFAELERLVLAYGFVLDRQRGSHRLYKRAGIDERLNLQPAGKEAKPYQVGQFIAIIRAHSLVLDDPA